MIAYRKFLVLGLAVLMLCSTSFVGIADEQNELIPEKIIRISADEEVLRLVASHGLSLAQRSSDEVLLYATESDMLWLEENDIDFEVAYESYFEMIGWIDGEPLETFHDYAAVTADLEDIADDYSSIAKLYNLGTSVQGRTIWGLKITDNPNIEENEPEVRFCGAHHGNEYMSVEMPILMAWYLVENYGSISRITDFVDTREIWIIPLVNPDGREAGTRQNANYVDLNRNYGYMWNGEGSGPYSEPEAQAIRENALENNFVLSLSFHTSGDIVNYLWNYKHQVTPDDDFIEWWSTEYGSYNGYWVTEGYDWYQTQGDTNDFSYGCRGDYDSTIELQNNGITECWDLNRDAMLDTLEYAGLGIHGVVTDAITDEPIKARITSDELFFTHFSDGLVGDFHIPTLSGTYHVNVEANGYESATFTVTVGSGGSITHDVELMPENNFYADEVTLVHYADPAGTFANNPTEACFALGAPDGTAASLGKSGYIVLDMGETGTIIDIAGESDFIVYEIDDADGYQVYVGNAWDGPWTLIGSGSSTTSFNLAGSGITEARFVKIVDDGDGDGSATNPCVDIDAVENLKQTVVLNETPTIPTISGPSSGLKNQSLDFTFTSTDTEGDPIYYYIDWGDASASEWIGPYDNSTPCIESHTYLQKGSYDIRAKARDDPERESDWSPIFEIDISAPKVEIGLIQGGFLKVTAPIRNVGDAVADSITWSIDLNGGLVLSGSHSEGVISDLAIGGSQDIESDAIIGLGTTVVHVDAEIPSFNSDMREQSALMLLIYTKVNYV